MSTQNTSRRLNPTYLEQGKEALHGLRTLKDYQPQRPEASVNSIEMAEQAMQEAQDYEAQLKAQYQVAMEQARLAEWAFHNCILEAKAAVVAQYGADSSQVQVVGRKKKSAYKRPLRQVKSA